MTTLTSTETAISSDNELLILVDENDNDIGHLNKAECHVGEGTLHRAFSIFIFNDNNELLLQQRSEHKRLWPGYWSNSCCSHPRQGETIEFAAQRRLKQELGLETSLKYVYKFIYQAQYDANGAEHELCSVFIGKTDQAVEVQPEEISAWRFMSLDDLQNEMAQQPDHFTPWFKQELRALQTQYSQDLEQLFN